jgi:O-antigen/teichoic acid export membrane protein
VFGLFAREGLAVLVPAPYVAAALPGALLCFAAVAHGAYYIAALGANLALRNDVLAWTSLAAAAIAVGLDLALVRPLGLLGVAIGTCTGFALSTVLLYAWAQRVHPIPFRGLRAAALYGLAVIALFAGLAAGERAGDALGAPASLAARAAALAAFAAVALWLARRMPPPWSRPLTAPGDATIPVILPEERA